MCSHRGRLRPPSPLRPRHRRRRPRGPRARSRRPGPEPGREQRVGEISPAAEAFGMHAGMRLGEALARCPSLALIPPDPLGVADAWEKVLARLESVGAEVESAAPGLAFFDAGELARLHGGRGPRTRRRSCAPAPPAARRRGWRASSVPCAPRCACPRASGPAPPGSARWPARPARARAAPSSSTGRPAWPPSR
ncbi:hypothetical protein FSW04_10955 [Baekduia soli]|uniref:UmuC domain-containing protein n=1 Tax=Baekduia soli TaxID=496014 RepID=A0A5B8U4J8_9ACTN|nr:hypothetical protein FSW04_10955 [Baekduia soli]